MKIVGLRFPQSFQIYANLFLNFFCSILPRFSPNYIVKFRLWLAYEQICAGVTWIVNSAIRNIFLKPRTRSLARQTRACAMDRPFWLLFFNEYFLKGQKEGGPTRDHNRYRGKGKRMRLNLELDSHLGFK